MPPRGLPTKSEQLDYLVQWFLEYSDVQKDDFLMILIDKFSPNEEGTLPDSLKILNVSDHPPSIFQCRMKLFNEWFTNWSDEEKTDLLSRLSAIDEKFIEKFHGETEVTQNNHEHLENNEDVL